MVAWLIGVALADLETIDAKGPHAAAPRREFPADVLDGWLFADQPVADGFVPAKTRSGWRVPADGRVVEVGPGRLVVEHLFYEDHHKRRVRSILPVDAEISVGTDVERGLKLGTARGDAEWVDVAHTDPAATPLEDLDPASFHLTRGSLFVPQHEDTLALVHHDTYTLRVYQRDDTELSLTYRIAFGQAKGTKTQRGDNRTPKGMYFVVEKSTGPFAGAVGPYFGGFWTKINYPNRYDADRGYAEGWISAGTAREIRTRWARRELTPQKTKLGSGIGFHGWIDEWSDAWPHLSWGCIVTHVADAEAIYTSLPVGTMVVLL